MLSQTLISVKKDPDSVNETTTFFLYHHHTLYNLTNSCNKRSCFLIKQK
jgi:hypothetical protein